ncbi:MAG: hypothetical protein M1372_03200 [Patescibacteria group bacterium]|nr:hypothetical protein [Patescibacteria group bacterium]
MNTLIIESADSKKITVGLKTKEKKYFLRRRVGLRKAQIVLPMIEKLLDSHSLGLKDIGAVEVNTGPGSFTGLRVGISIANALGFFLGIRINGKKIRQLAQPLYK